MKQEDSSQKLEATIHLSEKRGQGFGRDIQTYHTLNDGSFFRDDRRPFEHLKVLNDHHLHGGGEVDFVLNKEDVTMLLPIVGGLEWTLQGDKRKFLEVGNAIWISSPGMLKVKNSYEQEEINFLMITFRLQKIIPHVVSESSFDLEVNKNELVCFQPTESSTPLFFYIGAFEGRQKGVLLSGVSCYAFVISGAFEVEDRLLQPRDGLALKHGDKVEFESLSQNAVIIFFTW